MNTQDIKQSHDIKLEFDLSEVCEHYPDGCEFCDYNISGWCSLYMEDVPALVRELLAAQEEK